MTTRRLWLIDAGYLFTAQRSQGADFHFDYLKLRRKLEEDGPLWRAYYLNAVPSPPTDAQEGFHSWLRSAAPGGPQIITRLYPLKEVGADRAYCQTCGEKVEVSCPHGHDHRLVNQLQAGVDVGLATLALKHLPHYDSLVLSSGDVDLLDVVEHVTESGKQLELAVFRAGVATELQARAERIYWIDEFAGEVRR